MRGREVMKVGIGELEGKGRGKGERKACGENEVIGRIDKKGEGEIVCVWNKK